MLSRALCRFARFDLKSVAKAQRARALDLQVRQWSPYAASGTCVLWEQDGALVWVWDADLVSAAAAAHGLKPAQLAAVPETLFYPRRDNGIYLYSALDGFEGQIWRDGNLLGSRWWPAMPNGGEWLNFQRDIGAAADGRVAEVPQPLAAEWGNKPWGKPVSLAQTQTEGGRYERGVVYVAALSLLAPTLWYGMNLIKLRQAMAVRSTELRELSGRAEPIQAARGQALDALNRASALQSLNPYPDQLSLMGRVAEVLPKDGAYLKEWEFLNGKLKIVVTSPNKLVSSEYVKLFQAANPFKNVQALPGNDSASLALSMEVPALSEVEFAEKDGDPTKKDGNSAPLQLIKPL